MGQGRPGHVQTPMARYPRDLTSVLVLFSVGQHSPEGGAQCMAASAGFCHSEDNCWRLIWPCNPLITFRIANAYLCLGLLPSFGGTYHPCCQWQNVTIARVC